MQNDPNPEIIRIYNPLTRDFKFEWFDDKDQSHILTLNSLMPTTLPYSQGIFMAKHLADEICNERGIKNNQDEWNKVYAEVTINDIF